MCTDIIAWWDNVSMSPQKFNPLYAHHAVVINNNANITTSASFILYNVF